MKLTSIVCTFFFLVLITFACSKNTDYEIQKNKSENFKAAISNKRYKLVDFYSDLPIDYIENDAIIKAETDLRAYIKPYLADDEDLMDSLGNLDILQHNLKMPGVDSSTLYRKYAVRWNAKDVTFDFVDYYYVPSTYKLFEFSPDKFTIYLDWPKGGAKVFSRFELIR